MASSDSIRSGAVTVLKVGLPLFALILLSTVFLIARAPGGDGTIPYAEIEEIANEPRVSGAQISGVSEDGSLIQISAGEAKPDGNAVLASSLSADIKTAEGIEIAIRADEGRIDNETQIGALSGLVHLETSNGYLMETQGLIADMRSGRIESETALEIRGPFGSFAAGHLIIETVPETGQRMLFQEGVRLIYQPEQQD